MKHFRNQEEAAGAYANLAGLTSMSPQAVIAGHQQITMHSHEMPMHPPMIIEETSRGDKRGFDPYSRLLTDRIIMLHTSFDDHMAGIITSLLMWLDFSGEGDVTIYVNSPGGVVTSGMQIYDMMNAMNCDVRTIVLGQAASMGAVISSSGTKGKRFVLPNSQVMIHQPLGGARGQASDVEIQAEQIKYAKGLITDILCKNTGKERDVIEKAIDRDHYRHGKAAVEFGLADEVLDKLPKRASKGRGRNGGGPDAASDD